MTAAAKREPTGGARLGLIPRPMVAAISVLVIAVWALSNAAVVFVPGYVPPAEIHLAVMLVLSALFAARSKDDEKKPAEPAAPGAEPPPAAPPPPEAPEAEPPPPGGVAAADLIARLLAERGGTQPPERR